MNDKKYLIAGLGNAEQQYAGTRHNYGFEVVYALAHHLQTTFTTERLAYRATAAYKGRSLVLLMPTTLMNLSGKAVKYWLTKEDVTPDHCLIICDDLDLPLGTFKIKPKGSGGSHNGLNNIIECLGTPLFPRLRCGIGKEFAPGYQIQYVLSRFTSDELKIVEPCVARAVNAVMSFVTAGIEITMNIYNTHHDA